jgi:hypothetical protein
MIDNFCLSNPECQRALCCASAASPKLFTGFAKSGTGCGMDCPVNTATTQKGLIGGIDNDINILCGDIPTYERNGDRATICDVCWTCSLPQFIFLAINFYYLTITGRVLSSIELSFRKLRPIQIPFTSATSPLNSRSIFPWRFPFKYHTQPPLANSTAGPSSL